MRRKFTIEIISSLLILLFVYSALSELLDFRSFKYVLSRSPLIGDKAAVVALALPITMGLVSVLLFASASWGITTNRDPLGPSNDVIPRTRLWGLYGSLALMAVFTLYLAYVICFTPQLVCPCGGVLKQLTLTQHLIFNIFFLLLSLAGVVLQKKWMLKTKEKELPSVIFT